MPRNSMIIGGLLVLLGIIGFVAGGATSAVATALIPAAFGLVFIICGLIALKPNLRMHAMHGVALFALLGVGGGLSRVIKGLSAGRSFTELALASQLIMTLLCALLLFLCVRSFIAARKARKAEAAV